MKRSCSLSKKREFVSMGPGTIGPAAILLNDAAIAMYAAATQRWERRVLGISVLAVAIEAALITVAGPGLAQIGYRAGAGFTLTPLIYWCMRRHRENQRLLHQHVSLGAYMSHGTEAQKQQVLDTLIGTTEKLAIWPALKRRSSTP